MSAITSDHVQLIRIYSSIFIFVNQPLTKRYLLVLFKFHFFFTFPSDFSGTKKTARTFSALKAVCFLCCKILPSCTELHQALNHLEAHVQNKTDILLHTAELVQIPFMGCLDIIDQCGKGIEANCRLQVSAGLSSLYAGLEIIYTQSLKMILLGKTACLCFVMR